MSKENTRTGKDITAIKQLIAAADKYQNDIDSFIPLHTEEVFIVNFIGRRIMGKDSLYHAMKQALESPLAKVLTKIEIEDIRFVCSDIAIISCTKYVYDERIDSPDNPKAELPSSTGSLTYLVIKNQDNWRIALAQTTPIRK